MPNINTVKGRRDIIINRIAGAIGFHLHLKDEDWDTDLNVVEENESLELMDATENKDEHEDVKFILYLEDKTVLIIIRQGTAFIMKATCSQMPKSHRQVNRIPLDLATAENPENVREFVPTRDYKHDKETLYKIILEV